jgi:LPXTG-site transpeptidase (sortase) family protein
MYQDIYRKKKRMRIEKILGIVFLGMGSLLVIGVALMIILPPKAPAPLGILDGYGPDGILDSSALESDQRGSSTFLLSQVPHESELGAQNDDNRLASTTVTQVESGSLPSVLLPESSLESDRIEGLTAAVNAEDAGNAEDAVNSGDVGNAGIAGDDSLKVSQPIRISIPALGIDAPVQPVGLVLQESDGRDYFQWSTPDEYAVGWHDLSAPLGMPGNTVFNGHNNIHGAVFKDLADLELGERLILYDENRSYRYQITQRELFEEDGMPLKDRFWNARWMLPTSDERLTIITCWPNTTNSHRLVVIAHPIDEAGT